MSTLKEQLEELKKGQTPEQQAETTRTFNEVYAPPAPPAEPPNTGHMTDAQYREHVHKTYGYIPDA